MHFNHSFKPATSTKLNPEGGGSLIKISDIFMIDAGYGWAFERVESGVDRVLHTGDGGLTWRHVTPPEIMPTDAHKSAFGFFLDSEAAWIAYLEIPQPSAEYTIWRTFDGGQTWVSSHIIAAPNGEYLRIQFIDGNHGWVIITRFAGFGYVFEELYRTSDGGQHWERIMQIFTLCWKTGMDFVTAHIGWLTSECHGFVEGVFVEQTEDGGLTWQVMEIPEPEEGIFDQAWCEGRWPTLFEPQTGAFVLKCYSFQNDWVKEFLYRTFDGGQAWQSGPFPGGALQFVNPEVGWASGLKIYRTLDGGETWDKRSTVSWSGQFSFVSEMEGWAAVGAEEEKMLMHTGDGGQTWERLDPKEVPFALYIPIAAK